MNFTNVSSAETSVANALQQELRLLGSRLDVRGTQFRLAGIQPGSRLANDLERGGLSLHFPEYSPIYEDNDNSIKVGEANETESTPAYLTVRSALVAIRGIAWLLADVLPEPSLEAIEERLQCSTVVTQPSWEISLGSGNEVAALHYLRKGEQFWLPGKSFGPEWFKLPILRRTSAWTNAWAFAISTDGSANLILRGVIGTQKPQADNSKENPKRRHRMEAFWYQPLGHLIRRIISGAFRSVGQFLCRARGVEKTDMEKNMGKPSSGSPANKELRGPGDLYYRQDKRVPSVEDTCCSTGSMLESAWAQSDSFVLSMPRETHGPATRLEMAMEKARDVL